MNRRLSNTIMLMLLGVNVTYGQTVTAQTSSSDIKATLDVSTNCANIKFDASGNAVMTINGVTVYSVPVTDSPANNVLKLSFGGSSTSVSRTFDASTNYQTMYYPHELTVPSNGNVYLPTYDSSKHILKLTKKSSGTIIPVNTGLVIGATAGTTMTFSIPQTSPTSMTSALDGKWGGASFSDVTFESGKSLYMLGKNSNTYGFYLSSGRTTFDRGRAYLYVSTVSGAKISVVFDDDVTPVDDIPVEAAHQDSGTRKVMYNGQLVIIKNNVKYSLSGQVIQ